MTYPHVDTICNQCGERNTIFKEPEEVPRYRPGEKWTGKWQCDNCGWRGYPKGFTRA